MGQSEREGERVHRLFNVIRPCAVFTQHRVVRIQHQATKHWFILAHDINGSHTFFIFFYVLSL